MFVSKHCLPDHRSAYNLSTMRILFFLLCLLFTVAVFAQPRGSEYVDRVFLKNGRELRGTIVEYTFGERVAVVLSGGNVRELAWDEVRRVNFKLDKDRLNELSSPARQSAEEPEQATVAETPPPFKPSRTYRHQLSGAFNFGNSGTNFGFTTTTIGGIFAYHIARGAGPFVVGLGADLSLMSSSRNENVFAVTGLGEYALGREGKKVRPYFRLEAGPALPFTGNSDDGEVIKRSVNILFHPAAGLRFGPGEHHWTSQFIDFGYRFLNSKFTILTPNLDELERTVSYRRLVFRGGLRF